MVKVLKPFRDGDRIVHPGDHVHPTADRHAELARNGLVEPPTGDNAHKAKAPAKARPQAKADEVTSPSRPPRRKKLLG